MPELLPLLLYGNLYKRLLPKAKIVWENKVVEPFKVLISIGFVTYAFTLGLFSPIIVLMMAMVTRSYYWHGAVFTYILWFIYDYNTPQNGRGRVSEWHRHSFFYKKLIKEYFSMKIVKSGTSKQLDANKSYMIGYHPHGNAPLGYFCGFGTEAASYSEHFPHHDRHLFNHKMMFIMPFIRELQIAWGCHTVDRHVMDKVMGKYTNDSKIERNSNDDGNEKKKRSSLFLIVPGGIDEMMRVQANTLDLTIKNRKGFIRQAIRHGVDLIPAIGFGETELWDIYRPPKDSILFKIQDLARKYLLRFSLNYPIGAGLTPNSLGILPRGLPVTIVLGNIVPVERDASPQSDYVDIVHEKYVSEIERLFNETKDMYAPPGYQLVLH